jgi:hypothetical protein
MAFVYRLELEDGTPADPPTFKTAVSSWQPGDTIPLGAGKALLVVRLRPAASPEENPVLVVEEL